MRSEVQILPDPPLVLERGEQGNSLDGAIAQLGERLLCKQEVVGSIPTGSTIQFNCETRAPWRGVMMSVLERGQS